MKRLFLSALSIMTICSCSDREIGSSSNPKAIFLTCDVLTFKSTGGAETIWLYYDDGNAQWELTGGESWCTASKTSGRSDDQITFEVIENNNPDERNATFIFTCGTVSKELIITQKQKDALTVTSSKIEIDANGGAAIVEVNANIDYKYEIGKDCKEWITNTETRALQTTTLSFDVAQNTNFEKREGTIIISSSTLSETITIIQAGGKPTITVSQNEYKVSGIGENIAIEVSSNVELEVIKPSADWIKESNTQAISAQTKSFTIYANPTTQSRIGEIEFANDKYNLSTKVTINQAAASYTAVHVSQKGTLGSLLLGTGISINDITALKITGELNDEDFLYIGDLQELVNLDISEIQLTVLPNKCFAENENIQNIILPNTLTEIGDQMFLNCRKLQEIIIPQNVISIGERAFRGTAITNIVIPSNVKSIGKQAFCNLKLNSLKFAPNSNLGKIDEFAFGSSSLPDITIPASVEIIGEYAFQYCRRLTNVRFEPDSKLTTINTCAFGQSAITSIEIPTSVEYIGSSAFKQCQSLTTVIFAKNSKLQTIAGSKYDEGAFADCSSLRTIQIPASVTTIEAGAFKGCTSLETITFEKDSQLKKIAGAYSIPYPSLYYGAFANCTALTAITIPANVETIEVSAFQGCSSLQSVKFESNSLLSVIGGKKITRDRETYYYGAFLGCPIKIFDATECQNLTSIQECAFGVPQAAGNYRLATISLLKLGTINPPICNCKLAATGNSVLKVPAESIDAYKQAIWWKDFANISALDE